MLTLSLFTGVLTPDVVQQITLVEAANQSPIYSMAVGSGQVNPTIVPKPQWGVTSLGARRNQINNGGTAYTGSTTALVVDNASLYRPRDIVVAEATGEILLVVSVDTGTNTLTVRRGVGSTAGAAASVANDAWLQVVANASGEGADLGQSSETGITMKDNVVQIFRESVELSGTMLRSSTSTEPERPRQRRDAYERFIRNIEQAMVHGQKSEDKLDASNRLTRTMGGLREAITTHVTSGIGSMTEDAFYAAVEGCFAYGSGRKMMFAGPTVVSAVNKIFRGRSRTTNPDAPVGMKVERILVPWGELDMVTHRGLTGGFAGDALVVEMSEIQIRPLRGGQPGGGDFPQNGDMQLRENLQDKGDDKVVDEWFAEHTMAYGRQEFHAQLRGVTGGVTSNP